MKRYSIAEARNNFTSLVHAAEAGISIELTRRGKPIAVLLALEEYERLREQRRGFAQLYRGFLRRNPEFADNAIEPEEWLYDLRDDSPQQGYGEG